MSATIYVWERRHSVSDLSIYLEVSQIDDAELLRFDVFAMTDSRPICDTMNNEKCRKSGDVVRPFCSSERSDKCDSCELPQPLST
jgi:hypothetical protein